jgi:hypothetical protein
MYRDRSGENMMQDRRHTKTIATTWPVYPGPSDYLRLLNESVATCFSFWNVWTAFGRKCAALHVREQKR